MTMTTARDRAEELLGNLQKRARDLLAAEEGLAGTVRELIEQKGLSPVDVRKRLEELIGGIKANKVWDRIKTHQTVVALSDYDVRGELGRRANGLLTTLPVASQAEVDALTQRVIVLESMVADFIRKSS